MGCERTKGVCVWCLSQCFTVVLFTESWGKINRQVSNVMSGVDMCLRETKAESWAGLWQSGIGEVILEKVPMG